MKRIRVFPSNHARSPLTLRLTRLAAVSVAIAVLLPPSMLLSIAAPAPAKLQFAPPGLPEDPGEPEGRGRGGASRIPTCKPYQTFTALVPVAKNKTSESLWGLTTLDRPTFWFYLPQPLAAGMPIKFVLQDQDDNLVYETTLDGPTPAGIIRAALPATAVPLQAKRTYHWGVSVQCDPADPNAIVWLKGAIQRVSLPADVQQSLLAAKTPLDRATLYAKYGIWFEALTALGDAMQPHSTGDRAVATAWSDLLQQGQLGDIAKASIAPCCLLK